MLYVMASGGLQFSQHVDHFLHFIEMTSVFFERSDRL